MLAPAPQRCLKLCSDMFGIEPGIKFKFVHDVLAQLRTTHPGVLCLARWFEIPIPGRDSALIQIKRLRFCFATLAILELQEGPVADDFNERAAAHSNTQPDREAKVKNRRSFRLGKPPPVGMIGTILIIATLLAAGGSDLFRWLLMVLGKGG